MDFYVLDNGYDGYSRKEIIDAYESAIWTERFKGDGDFELHLPVENPVLSTLPTGTLLECEGSEQPMIIEEIETENGVTKLSGTTITQWFNNRFLRSSTDHTVKEWEVTDVPLAQLICNIVNWWCVDSEFLSSGAMGFDANYLKIPGLFVDAAPANNGLVAMPHFTGAIEFGGIYDIIRPFADQAGVGLKVYLHDLGNGQRNIGFAVYPVGFKANVNVTGKIVIFSPQMETFENIKELQSESDHWNEVYMWLANIEDLTTQPEYNYGGYVRTDWTHVYQNGQSSMANTPWNRRVRMTFSEVVQEDYDSWPVWNPSDPDHPFRPDTPIDTELKQHLVDHKFVHLIDGEIVPSDQLKYGVDYKLGDIVAMQGYTRDIIAGQVTEFIRSKDSSGEKTFPTVEAYPGYNVVWRSEFP